MAARPVRDSRPNPYIVPGIALAAAVIFLATAFRDGWNRAETDFPNYYTAAALVRKGARLHNYYDWPWFQRQMNYAGIENQLGGYIPQTPLTMLPIVPLAGLAPQTAKRVWLLFNLMFLAATILMLSRVTGFGVAPLALLAFAGWGSLHANYLLGQYYVFLLFLLTVAFYWLHRGHAGPGGFAMGIVCGLKLYGAPFLLYFAVKRRGKELAGMAAALFGLAALAIVIFGWTDTVAYATQILPRSLAGETLDPYHPGNGTLSTLLRRALVMEPELNPHPLANAPGAYFFLQAFAIVTVLVFPLLALRRSTNLPRDFAWFVIVLLLASPNTASYTFILLLLPITLLLEEAARLERLFLIVSYVLLTYPTPRSSSWLFPKVWLLMALVSVAGRPYWRMLEWRPAMAATSLAIALGGLSAAIRMASYSQEPGRRFERIAVERGAVYSSAPAVLRSGIVYDSIGAGHYVLRWLHENRVDRFAFDGEALSPVALSPDGPIQFELVAHRTSTFMLLDPFIGKVVPQPAAARHETARPAPSPDGKWLAFTVQQRGSTQVWLQHADGSAAAPLTGGACNNFAPAWELDSKAIVFASDCDRGVGLPALYRARVK
ncbi:MAG TPA: glycosyltransferase 87 family protein [Candidatus Acidoferrales bacterium]|jgi:hypothetical protein|nr:glycosyltransferase 87 family protein [Candidatus Acidoferrales bacterium]